MENNWQRHINDGERADWINDSDFAEAQLLKAIAISKQFPAPDLRHATSLENLAMFYRARFIVTRVQSKFDLALLMYQKALDIWKSVHGENSREYLSQFELIALLFCDDKPEEARRILNEVQTRREQVFGAESIELCLGNLFLAQRDWADGDDHIAKQKLERAIAIAENSQDPAAAWYLATSLTTYANMQSDPARAEELLRRVLTLEEQMYGGNHVALMNTLELLGRTLQKQGKTAEAEQVFSRQRSIHEHGTQWT